MCIRDRIKFFQEELARLGKMLTAAEDSLIEYNIENRILNYGEQTKQVASMDATYRICLLYISMETIIFDSHFLHEFKAGIHLILGSLHLIGITVLREFLCSAAKLITALGTQRMPPCHSKLQPVLDVYKRQIPS